MFEISVVVLLAGILLLLWAILKTLGKIHTAHVVAFNDRSDLLWMLRLIQDQPDRLEAGSDAFASEKANWSLDREATRRVIM